MNRNNSSSEINIEEELDPFMGDLKPTLYGGDIQRLKCENFQLRLKCYNYECSLNEIENRITDEEVSNLKRYYEQKIEHIDILEIKMKSIENENFYLKEKLNDLLMMKDMKPIHSTQDNETQETMDCTDCFEKVKILKSANDTLNEENVNLKTINKILEKEVDEMKRNFVKVEGTEVSCNTEIKYLYDIFDERSPPESECEDEYSNELMEQPLNVIIQGALSKLESFISKYETRETRIRNLESAIIQALQYFFIEDTITNDTYKKSIYNDKDGTSDSRLLSKMLKEGHNQLITVDLQPFEAFLSDTEDETFETPLMNTVSVKNPNILAINSILEKLNEKKNENEHINSKILKNKKWMKHVSKFKQSKSKTTFPFDIRDDIDIYIEHISELTTILTRILPAIQITFSKTIDHLKVKRSSDKNGSTASMINNHEKNEKSFLDNCNIFIKSISNCMLALSKEKMFLNSAFGILSSTFVEDYNDNFEVEVMCGSQYIKKNPSIGPAKKDQGTSKQSAITFDVLVQTEDQTVAMWFPPQVLKPCQNHSENLYNSKDESEEAETSSQISNETFTVDDSNIYSKNQSINIRACGDVISNDISKKKKMTSKIKKHKLVNEKKNKSERYRKRKGTSSDQLKKDEIRISKMDSNTKVDLDSENEGCHSISLHASNSKTYFKKITHTFSSNSSRKDCSSLSRSSTPIDKEGMEEQNEAFLNIYKLRTLKLLYIHDLKKYMEMISKNDIIMGDIFTGITAQNTGGDLQKWIEESPSFMDIQESLEQWRHEVELFSKGSRMCSNVIERLLKRSDKELIHMMCSEQKSELGLTLEDISLNETIDKEIEDLGRRYAILEDIYGGTMKQLLSLLSFLKSENLSNLSLFAESKEKVKSLYDISVKDNQFLQEQIDQIKSDSETYIIEATKEKCRIKDDLNRVLSENIQLSNSLEKSSKDYSLRFEQFQDDIEEHFLCNENLRVENKSLLEFNSKLSLEIESEKENNRKCMTIIRDKDSELDTLVLNNEKLEKENEIIRQHEKQLLFDVENAKKTAQESQEKSQGLKMELSNSMSMIKDQAVEILNVERNYQNKIFEMEGIIKGMVENSLEIKRKIFNLEEEVQNSNSKVSMEKLQFIELNKKYQMLDHELEGCRTDLKIKNDELHLTLKKLKIFDSYSEFLKKVEEKFVKIVDGIVELLGMFGHQIDVEFPTFQNKEVANSKEKNFNELTKLTTIISAMDILLKILENEMKNEGDRTQHFHVETKVSVQANVGKIAKTQDIEKCKLEDYFENNSDKTRNKESHEERRSPNFSRKNGLVDTKDTSDYSDQRDTYHIIQSLFNKFVEENSFSNTKEFQEFCNILNLIASNNSGSSQISCYHSTSNNSSQPDIGNIEKLIDTNRSLTNNLMKTTRQLLSLQNKFELLNNELRESQMSKHQMSVELGLKYQSLSQVQSELDYVKGVKTSLYVDRISQTNLRVPENHKDSMSEIKYDDCSRNSSSTICKSEFICEPPKSRNCTDVKGNWDDVTRTMIRCLTTLTEVQESLVTPPPGDEPFQITPEINIRKLEADSYTDSIHPTAEISKSNKNEDAKNDTRVTVAVIKEEKYENIRRLILKIREIIREAGVSKNMSMDTMALTSRIVKKIYSILTDDVIIRELSDKYWRFLVDGFDIMKIEPCLNYPKNDPLEATDRVQSDIVRLQQRLERYQSRYKTLKNAVLKNKVKINGSYM